MAIARYSPFADTEEFPAGLRVFQDTVNRLFNEPSGSRPWTPPVDVVETENELIFKADVPDVDLKDIDIKIENGTLALTGQRKFEQKENHKGFHRIERSYGSFARYFTLPDTVDTENVKAAYQNGVLTIKIAKKEVAKPKSIKVEVNNN